MEITYAIQIKDLLLSETMFDKRTMEIPVLLFSTSARTIDLIAENNSFQNMIQPQTLKFTLVRNVMPMHAFTS